MDKTFHIPRAGTTGIVVLIVIALALLLFAGWMFSKRSESLAGAIIGVSVTLPLALMFTWFLIQQGRSTLTLTTESLKLDVPWYAKQVSLADVETSEVRLLTDGDAEEWSFKWRTNGIGLPEYQVGWFSTKAGHRVLAAKTRGENVLIPTTKGFALVVSLNDPEVLIEALRGTAP